MQNTVAFIPNGLRYLVLPDPVEAKSETFGDITISQQADIHQKASEGTVVSVGDGLTEALPYYDPQTATTIPTKRCKYKPGDKLIYGKYAGYEQTFDGIEYKVLSEDEILGLRVAVPTFQPPFGIGQSGHALINAEGPDEPGNWFKEPRPDCINCGRPITNPDLSATDCGNCPL